LSFWAHSLHVAAHSNLARAKPMPIQVARNFNAAVGFFADADETICKPDWHHAISMGFSKQKCLKKPMDIASSLSFSKDCQRHPNQNPPMN
jgi:hypothetical protein